MAIELSYGLIGCVYGIICGFLSADSNLINSPITLLLQSISIGILYSMVYEIIGSLIDSLIPYYEYKIYSLYTLTLLASYSIIQTTVYGNNTIRV